MIIDFNKIEKEEKINFRGGEGIAIFYAYRDNINKIFKIVLNPGCSIGMHSHENDQEIMFLLDGILEIIDDDVKIIMNAGQVNYCIKSHRHSIKNISDTPAILICSVSNI